MHVSVKGIQVLRSHQSVTQYDRVCVPQSVGLFVSLFACQTKNSRVDVLHINSRYYSGNIATLTVRRAVLSNRHFWKTLDTHQIRL